jgi:glutamate-5-semialdehyde dehydrogenase
MLRDIGLRARQAAVSLAQTTDGQRAGALLTMAGRLMAETQTILAANREDLDHAMDEGLPPAMLDRLALNPARVADMARGLEEAAALKDPLGEVQWKTVRPNGLKIRRISVPLGVVAVIFEARPNVAADAAGLCLRAGNACILRGGREAIRSNLAVAAALRKALEAFGLPEDAVQLVDDTSRESADELMCLDGFVDVLIPRGGQGLIRRAVEYATVPVIQTGEGVCHIFVDKDADVTMAADIIHNAKTSRCSVCNACECMLIHQDIAPVALPVIAGKLMDAGVAIRGDTRSREICPEIAAATDQDWGREFLDLIIACRVVRDMEEALDHIARYGTGHSEAIITEDKAAASRFLSRVDAAAVYHNASTRFTDGGEFGFGAEIGISTQKLHARGPVGVKSLTSYKYMIEGTGQTR